MRGVKQCEEPTGRMMWQREDLKRLAWFSTEFGLIRENGDLKTELASYFDTF